MADTNLETLLSKERLKSYDYNINKHYENLRLIGKITSKIATLEIILRNKLDSVLSLKLKDNEWIKNAKDNKIIEAREKIEKSSNEECLSHHQYLSRMSLGVIIHTIRKEKLQNNVMDTKQIKFKNYDNSNIETFINHRGKKCHFSYSIKVDIILSLLQNLRNRSYHWENIMKVRVDMNNGIAYPRLTTKKYNTLIGVNPNKIELFLEDLIKTYDEKFLDYC
ncbi:hypothetical protein [Helicobacter pullorum]|uniref:hypothetical protein n=1 Tax=Helicobacter pullorum TaxID=35818 RepID=UPI0006CD54DB|nr:hypothetical protein [Helicobacter pullorum]KPH53935.1 hypothetical protein HPU229254_09810 [Helicobacter pullorum]